MRHFAITGIVTFSWISLIFSGSLIRATPPSRRMSAGTRSSAITATAPASSAIRACSASTTSMMTPPLSISAMPRLTRTVPVSDMAPSLRGGNLEVVRREQDERLARREEQRLARCVLVRGGLRDRGPRPGADDLLAVAVQLDLPGAGGDGVRGAGAGHVDVLRVADPHV